MMEFILLFTGILVSWALAKIFLLSLSDIYYVRNNFPLPGENMDTSTALFLEALSLILGISLVVVATLYVGILLGVLHG